jgi:hypothetical protein
MMIVPSREDNDERWRRGVDLSLQQAPEQRRRGHDDVEEWLVLVTLRRERWRATKQHRRWGGDNRAEPLNAPSGGQ